MRIAVIGAGYVGLVQAVMLANFGHNVAVGERDQTKTDELSSGVVPFYEPGLKSQLNRVLDRDLIRFTTANDQAVKGAEIVFLALPTPPAADGSADISAVLAVVKEIAPVLESNALVVTKSTIPVGTTDRIQRLLDASASGAVAVSNPEFLREGSAVRDFLEPDRIVLGAHRRDALKPLEHVYARIDAPIVITDPLTSELIKYASNAFLASKITFANLIANLCEKLGADAETVLQGMGMDNRIGGAFLRPGPGFGGSCFGKDVSALAAMVEESEEDSDFLRAVERLNTAQAVRVVRKVEDHVGSIHGATVALWGLAFKAGTSDTRDSPAVSVARLLVEKGARVRAYDPEATVVLDSVEQSMSALAACEDAVALVVATEWSEFAEVDLYRVAGLMVGKVIVDSRNVLDRDLVSMAGLNLIPVGRAVGS